MCHIMILFHNCSMTKDENSTILCFCHVVKNIGFIMKAKPIKNHIHFVKFAFQDPLLCSSIAATNAIDLCSLHILVPKGVCPTKFALANAYIFS